jgi:alanyl aminopeptidase
MRALALAVLLSSCAVAPATVTTAPQPPLIVSLPAATPPTFRLDGSVRPVRYTATLAVDPGTERFSGEISIDLELAAKTQAIWLHGLGLEIDRAEVVAGGGTIKGTAQRGDAYLGDPSLPTNVGSGGARLTPPVAGRSPPTS